MLPITTMMMSLRKLLVSTDSLDQPPAVCPAWRAPGQRVTAAALRQGGGGEAKQGLCPHRGGASGSEPRAVPRGLSQAWRSSQSGELDN